MEAVKQENNGVIYYPGYRLDKKNACLTRRKTLVPYVEPTADSIRRARLMKDCIRDLLDGKMLDSELPRRLVDAFRDFDYESGIQRRLQIDDAYRQIVRCVKSFPPVMPVHAGLKEIRLTEHTGAKIRPSFVLYEPNGNIDVISIKVSAPKVTQSRARENIELFAYLCYARTLVPAGQTRRITASFWYLRRVDDKPNKEDPISAVPGNEPENERKMIEYLNGLYADIKPEFFKASGRNVISVTENYCNDGTIPELSDLPGLEKALDAFETGVSVEECTDKECGECDLRDACRYTMPPQALKTEEREHHIGDIVLSKEQEDIVEAQGGLFRVNAGAGAGKTMVVVLRIIMLLNTGTRPEEILVVTFSNTAAEELRKRISLANKEIGTGEDISGMTITTFNAFGDRLIRENPSEFGYNGPTSVIDDVRRSRIISDMLKDRAVPGLDYRHYTFDEKYVKGALAVARKVFDLVKKYKYWPEEADKCMAKMGVAAEGYCTKEAVEQLIRMYPEYENALRKECLIEFSDQETLVIEKLHGNPYYFEPLGYRHIIVDEFQDTSEQEIEILKGLRRAANGSQDSLMVVGDDDQAIYGFRDTSPYYITHFTEVMGEPVTDFFMLGNYRSTPEIIDDFANKIAGANKCRTIKQLRAMRPRSGRAVQVHGLCDREEELDKAVQIIRDCMSRGYAPEDICIICSKGSELDRYADRLTEEGIASTRINPEKYLDNSRVQAAFALARLVDDRDDYPACLIAANAKLEALGAGSIFALPEETRSLMVDEIREWANAFDRLSRNESRKKALVDMMRSFQAGGDEVYARFLETIENETQAERILAYCRDAVLFRSKAEYRRQKKYPGVALITAHSSKGAEWPVVINSLSGYDSREYHGKLTWNKKTGAYSDKVKGESLEERRRLMFVSATRARDELYMIGQWAAYSDRYSERYVYNQFLLEAMQYAGIALDFNEIEFKISAFKKKKKTIRMVL